MTEKEENRLIGAWVMIFFALGGALGFLGFMGYGDGNLWRGAFITLASALGAAFMMGIILVSGSKHR